MGKVVPGSTATSMFGCWFLSLPHQPSLIITKIKVQHDHGVSVDREGVWSQHMAMAFACQLACWAARNFLCFGGKDHLGPEWISQMGGQVKNSWIWNVSIYFSVMNIRHPGPDISSYLCSCTYALLYLSDTSHTLWTDLPLLKCVSSIPIVSFWSRSEHSQTVLQMYLTAF